MITTSQEDYLKVIYNENLKQNKINNKFIANTLNISAPSVSAMIKKMKDESFITDSKNYGIVLTDKGQNEVKLLLSKHRLWELFLINHLGYTWDSVHLDADMLEHVTSTELMNKLNHYLNYPKSCPHGKTIYINNNIDSYENTYKLSLIKKDFNGIIKILDDEEELLIYLDKKGVKIGDEFKFISLDSFDNSITISIKDKLINLSEKATNKIYVKKL